jgi:hypothetical protein
MQIANRSRSRLPVGGAGGLGQGPRDLLQFRGLHFVDEHPAIAIGEKE